MRFGRIFLDMYGVVADFVAGTLKKFGVKHDPYLNPGNFCNWYVQDLLGIPGEEFYGALDEAFWSNLPLTEEALAVVDAAEGAVKAGHVHFLTSPCASPHCYSGKYLWLRAHFPHLKKKYVPTPEKFLLSKPGRLLVDDSDDNCERWESRGGTAFLLPRPWNSRHGDRNRGLELFKDFLLKESVACP